MQVTVQRAVLNGILVLAMPLGSGASERCSLCPRYPCLAAHVSIHLLPERKEFLLAALRDLKTVDQGYDRHQILLGRASIKAEFMARLSQLRRIETERDGLAQAK